MWQSGKVQLPFTYKLLAEYQPDLVNRHLSLLMSTMNWSIRPTDPVTAINELDLRINAYELQSGERMADTVQRGVLLTGLAPFPEVQKHVMKDSARLNSYAQMRAEVVELLRAEAALHMPMEVDGALTGPKGKEKTKGIGKPDDQEGKGKGKKGEETRVCHECNKPGHLRNDCTVYKKRLTEKGGNKEKTDTTAAVQVATAAVQGAMFETWEYTEDDHVFAFGEAVIAAVQRPEAHICIASGASRLACPIGYAPDVSAKGTAPPLFSIDGSPIE